jgi:hypothetical protein
MSQQELNSDLANLRAETKLVEEESYALQQTMNELAEAQEKLQLLQENTKVKHETLKSYRTRLPMATASLDTSAKRRSMVMRLQTVRKD